MELDTIDVIALDDRRERQAIIDDSYNVIGAGRDTVVAMDEVGVAVGVETIEERGMTKGTQMIPAHVRDFEIRTLGKAGYMAGEQA
jgi:hypothetical protein